MSVECEAVIVVGLQNSALEQEEIGELLYDEKLQQYSPYADGEEDENAIVGLLVFRSGEFDAIELEWDESKIAELKKQFFDLTGKEAKIYLSPWNH